MILVLVTLLSSIAGASTRCDASRLQAWGGSYFRKVVSSTSTTSYGISGIAVLPIPRLDSQRQFFPKENTLEWQIGPLDRPSLYVGGHSAGKELDTGLTWNRVYDQHGRFTYTDDPSGSDGRRPARRFVQAVVDGRPTLQDGEGKIVAEGEAAVAKALRGMSPNFAFRPFWRTTNRGGNQWNLPQPGSPLNVYFYPGERVSVTLELLDKNYFEIRIVSTDAAPGSSFSLAFAQEKFDPGGSGPEHYFKRVNSIDQYQLIAGARKGNENKDVLPTTSRATGGGWERVEILEPGGPVPLAGALCTEVRGQDNAAYYDKIFLVSGLTPDGGERLDILPEGRK